MFTHKPNNRKRKSRDYDDYDILGDKNSYIGFGSMLLPDIASRLEPLKDIPKPVKKKHQKTLKISTAKKKNYFINTMLSLTRKVVSAIFSL